VLCGKYRIESIVGEGGMGIVLGAVDTSLGRPVAIKLLLPQQVAHDGAVPRFLREARAAAAIQSEHVVRVFEVSTLPDGSPFIVMEHLRGADLAHILAQRGALSVEEACDVVLQVCEALAEAHAHGIVHRDLKPQNLFLTQRPDGSPCVKVLDFGISKAADEGAPNLTSTGMVMGTPLYMSPQQVRALKTVDARADIWALGAILFELLTTSSIYQAPSVSALCAMIAMDPPTPLRARRPEAPALARCETWLSSGGRRSFFLHPERHSVIAARPKPGEEIEARQDCGALRSTSSAGIPPLGSLGAC
jgi:serine/threonine-protein kinase